MQNSTAHKNNRHNASVSNEAGDEILISLIMVKIYLVKMGFIQFVKTCGPRQETWRRAHRDCYPQATQLEQ